MSRRRTFAVPPRRAPQGAKAKGPARPARTPRTFAVPEPATFASLVPAVFRLPPREVCEDCGARSRQLDAGGGVVVLESDPHAGECFYADWPRRVVVEPGTVRVHDGDQGAPAWLLRPTLARELQLPVTRCAVCRGSVTGDLEYDRHTHQGWCTFWDAHPDLTPF